MPGLWLPPYAVRARAGGVGGADVPSGGCVPPHPRDQRHPLPRHDRVLLRLVLLHPGARLGRECHIREVEYRSDWSFFIQVISRRLAGD
eukprot:538244-Prymnesium_polylepis.1